MTKIIGNSLDNFKLEYEEMEFHKVKKTDKVKVTAKTTSTSATKRKAKVSPKDRVKAILKAIRARFDNILKKLKLKGKKTKKATKMQKKLERQQQIRGILGLGLLFVVVSITYSTYVIYNGVSSSASRLMLIPQVVFALYTLFKAFSKIYK